MSENPDNRHVWPMLGVHFAGLAMTVMGAVSLYGTVVNGLRVRDRSNGGYWSLFETLQLEGGILAAGILLAWLGQRRPRV